MLFFVHFLCHDAQRAPYEKSDGLQTVQESLSKGKFDIIDKS